MGQMLRALKNLEARGDRPPVAAGVLAHLAEQPAPRAAEQQPQRPLDADNSAPPLLSSTATLTPPPRAQDDIVDKLLNRNATPANSPSETASPREPSQLERAVQRTLNSPLRAAPLKQMANRLLADVRQSRSRTLLMVGVGDASPTHESLLYNGALVAGQFGKVLLVDGDLRRGTLTLGLEHRDEPGLAEVVRGGNRAAAHCRPTALDGVWLLPAGRLQPLDRTNLGSSLGEVLHDLSAEFQIILVDGGSTDDASALVWARLCDATYFVVRLGMIEAREAQSALRSFRAGGARVLGCIAA